MAIWQDLVTDHGFTGAYNSVKRFVRKLRGIGSNRKRSGIIITGPGEEAQVDYGTGPMVRDPQTGKYRRTRLFVMTLGYSRKAVRLLVFRSSTRTWAELHETAFRRLGGSCRVVVLDNLNEGVLTPDIYDPTLNPLFETCWPTTASSPALPRSRSGPQRQSRIRRRPRPEDAAERTALRKPGRSSGLSGQLGSALGRHAHSRHHQTAGRGDVRRRKAVRCCRCRWNRSAITNTASATVHLDGCVEVEAAYYSAPPGWIGRLVQVQWDALHVRLLDPETRQLLREHLRQQRGRHRIQSRRPSEENAVDHDAVAGARRSSRLSHRRILRSDPSPSGRAGIRRILGVLSLAKKYGVRAVEDACAAALELRVYEYRFVRRYLERRPPLTLRQVDPLIRQLTLYRDLINLKTQEQNHESD